MRTVEIAATLHATTRQLMTLRDMAASHGFTAAWWQAESGRAIDRAGYGRMPHHATQYLRGYAARITAELYQGVE